MDTILKIDLKYQKALIGKKKQKNFSLKKK